MDELYLTAIAVNTEYRMLIQFVFTQKKTNKIYYYMIDAIQFFFFLLMSGFDHPQNTYAMPFEPIIIDADD